MSLLLLFVIYYNYKEQMKKDPNCQEPQSQYNEKICKEALSLFMSGQKRMLQEKLTLLAEISKLSNTLNPKIAQSAEDKVKEKGKFHYQLNFDEQQPDEHSKKQKAKPKPLVKSHRKSEYCMMCPDNEQINLLSASNYVYLALPKTKTFRKYYHFLIAPVDHIQTRIGADEGVVQQIKNYQKCLIQMFDKMGLHAIFLQQFFSSNSHIYLQCIGIPLKKAYDLPFFFKQALENVEGFWVTHKKIIQIRKQKGGLQKQIPKQIKYFYIDFGLGYGYAHVIEDEKFWDRKFCYEIVAAALGLYSYQVKTTQQYSQQQIQIKSKQFNKIWKPFDWTTLLQNDEKK